jgi:hypothetical protein
MNSFFLSLLGQPTRRESGQILPNGNIELVGGDNKGYFVYKNNKFKLNLVNSISCITIHNLGTKIIFYKFPERIAVENKNGNFQPYKMDYFPRRNYMRRLILFFGL